MLGSEILERMNALAFSSIATFIKRRCGSVTWLRGKQSSHRAIKHPVYDPLDLIHTAMAAHGLLSVRNEHEVRLDQHHLRFQAAVFEKDRPGPGYQLVLEIYIFSPLMPVQPIAEAFVGLGDTRDEAIVNAFEKFLRGTFHVVIEALADHVCDQMQAEVEFWRRPDASWKVYAGPVITYSAGQSTLGGEFPKFFQGLEHLFSTTVSPGSHFVRVFIASHAGAVIGREVLLDNETWTQGEELLAAQDWQCGEEYQSLREVILALPALAPLSYASYNAPQSTSKRGRLRGCWME